MVDSLDNKDTHMSVLPIIGSTQVSFQNKESVE